MSALFACAYLGGVTSANRIWGLWLAAEDAPRWRCTTAEINSHKYFPELFTEEKKILFFIGNEVVLLENTRLVSMRAD